MQRTHGYVAMSIALFGLLGVSAHAAGGTSPSALLLTTLTSPSPPTIKTAELSIVFIQESPDAKTAEAILRKSLEAAAELKLGADIIGRAWFSPSGDSAERTPIALGNSAQGLLLSSANRSISSITEGLDGLPNADLPAGDEVSEKDAIIRDEGVTQACKAVKPAQLAKLVDVAIESRGDRRSQIVRGLRNWSKNNGVTLDRAVSLCVVAISKAAFQEPKEPAATAEVSAEAIKRGAEAYKKGNCARCHREDGRGGQRGPNLTNGKWDHSDGSIEGIRKVLIAGVSPKDFKDPDRPFQMNPATNFLNDKEIADLAVYVQSLSKK